MDKRKQTASEVDDDRHTDERTLTSSSSTSTIGFAYDFTGESH